METKYKRTKNSLSYHKPKFGLKLAELLQDSNITHKNSLSTQLPNTSSLIQQSASTKNLPMPLLKPLKSFNSKSSNLKNQASSHLTPIQFTPKCRLISKDKQFFTSESIKTQLNPETVLRYFKFDLTEYEKIEIVKYEDIYYFGKLCNKTIHKSELDDSRGDYLFKVGDHIAYRYEILGVLGKGNFGQVLLCLDHKRNENVAVKIVRNKKRFTKQAAVEIKVLKALNDCDLDGKNCVAKLKTYFNFRNHACMVFNLMEMNLFELLEKNNFQGFSLNLIKRFAIQILNCLESARRLGIIHCDLKPENIMLVNKDSTAIKVIDFGTSCYENERIYTYIQSRFYRAPEIILGIPYTSAIDMWSLGCIICEFFTGYPLFTGDSESQQLSFIIEVLGPPPKPILSQSTKLNSFFSSQGSLLKPSSPEDLSISNIKPIDQVLQEAPNNLKDFIKKCLDWDPASRLTPKDALKHSFLFKSKKSKKKPAKTLK